MEFKEFSQTSMYSHLSTAAATAEVQLYYKDQ